MVSRTPVASSRNIASSSWSIASSLASFSRAASAEGVEEYLGYEAGAYRTVVVGTDGSESSLRAVRRAGARIRLIPDGDVAAALIGATLSGRHGVHRLPSARMQGAYRR